MKITYDNALGQNTQQLFFDGKKHLTKNPAGLDTWLTTTWSKDGKALTSTGPSKTEDGLPGTVTEIRTLSADGTTLFLTINLELSNGRSASVKRVFRKVR